MIYSICGVDCSQCTMKDTCGGCIATNGHPFHGDCVIAVCCLNKGNEHCGKCSDSPCKLKERLISEFNELEIADMEEVKSLHALKGSFINLEYKLQSGQTVKLWDDEKIYLGNQICKKNSNRCYGLAADENYLSVCEYGDKGTDAEIIVYKKRR